MDDSVELPAAGLRDDRNLAHPQLLAPPAAVLRVPRDGSAKTLFERDLRSPAEDPLRFARIRRVAEHLPGPVADVRNQVVGLAHEADDQRGYLRKRDALAVAKVDDLTNDGGTVAVHKTVEGTARIADVREVALGAAVAMDAQRLIQQTACDEPGNHLFKM